MKTSEPAEQIVPFKATGCQSEEVFGKIKRPDDPSVKELLSWQESETQPKPSKTVNKNLEWISEAHDSFKTYMVASLSQPRPFTGFQVKPIEEVQAKPQISKSPDEVRDVKGKRTSVSPDGGRKGADGEKASKTPKSGKNASQRQLERLKKLNQTTRWLPKTAFKTYFGKPVFANYGQGNTNPAYGGLMYGDYMKTHNIAPHEGANNPSTQQVYEIAETKALQKQSKPQIVPRKCKDEDRLPPEEVDKLKKRSLILPKDKNKASKKIIKPNLLEEKIFKSEHGTPTLSEGEEDPTNKPKPENSKFVTSHIKKTKPEQTKKQITGKKISEPIDKNPLTSLPAAILPEPIPEVEHHEEVHESPEAPQEHRDEEKSHDASVQAEDPHDCNHQLFSKLVRTPYQDMTSKTVVDKNNHVVEPYKYCARCRDCLYSDDVLRPPYSLGEIPPQELDPKNYKTLPPQWTQRIPAAGRLSYRSPSAYQVIFGENQPLGGYS